MMEMIVNVSKQMHATTTPTPMLLTLRAYLGKSHQPPQQVMDLHMCLCQAVRVLRAHQTMKVLTQAIPPPAAANQAHLVPMFLLL